MSTSVATPNEAVRAAGSRGGVSVSAAADQSLPGGFIDTTTVGQVTVADPVMGARKVNVHYGAKHAIKDVSIDVARNAVIAFIGPSGCGKSTFLRCLNRMNDTIEGTGQPIGRIHFNFASDEDKKVALAGLQTDVQGLHRTLNACLSRGYLKRTYMTQQYVGIALTEEGQGRAISADAASRRPKPVTETPGTIHIGTVNANGATQIGHGNVQNVEGIVQAWLKQIDAADATQDQKDEAKGLLRKFIEHPLVNTCLGVVGGVLAQKLGAS